MGKDEVVKFRLFDPHDIKDTIKRIENRDTYLYVHTMGLQGKPANWSWAQYIKFVRNTKMILV